MMMTVLKIQKRRIKVRWELDRVVEVKAASQGEGSVLYILCPPTEARTQHMGEVRAMAAPSISGLRHISSGCQRLVMLEAVDLPTPLYPWSS